MDAVEGGQRPGSLGQAVAGEVRAIIARRRISAVQLAKLMGVSQPYLSRRLNGAVPFDLDDIDRIARALDLDVMTLLKGAQEAAGEIRRTSTRPQVRSASHVVRTTPDRPVVGKRRDSVRPVSAIPVSQRRPVSVRSPAKPLRG